MKDSDRKFWPYKPKVSILLAFIILTVLLVAIGILRSTVSWPADGSTNTVLIGILLLSVVPILFAILDVIIERGGSIGFKDFKIDFSKVTYSVSSGIVVPPNIGGLGIPVNESSIMMILEALKKAGESSIVIVDIEDGTAWWETRLLLLVAGATRLGKPDKIVFTGKISQQEQYFLGWAKPSSLLTLLLNSNQIYNRLYHISKAAASQWALVEPAMPGQIPLQPSFVSGLEAGMCGNIAFDPNGLPNEFLPEQIMGRALGNQVEQSNLNLNITQGKLIDLFGRVLMKDQIDENWVAEQQLKLFFESDNPFVALTKNGKYLKLVLRLSILNEILRKNMFTNKQKNEN